MLLVGVVTNGLLGGQVILSHCKLEIIKNSTSALSKELVILETSRIRANMEFLFFSLPGRHCGFYLFDLGEAWAPSVLIDFEMRCRHATVHKMKSLLACGNKSLHHSATCVPVRMGKGAGCNKLYWRLRISELYRKNMEPLWSTKPHFTRVPCMVMQRPSGLHQHPQSPWQGPNSEKERLIQTENSIRPHPILFSGSEWTTVITSRCFSFHFQYPHIYILSSCFLLAKTEPATNLIDPQAPNIIAFNNAYITRNECMV